MSQNHSDVISLADFGLHCIRPCEADLAIIFVHGILSDGEHAWGDPSWPNLLADEPVFGKAGIFVFTYKTGLWSHTYSITNVAEYLRENLRLSKLLEVSKLVFVCHSMGGIVVRRFLTANDHDLIKRKLAIGLFLVASPSIGASDANLLSVLSYALQHTQAASLRLSQANTTLDDLNKDFWALLNSGQLSIKGRELLEDRAIPVKRWLGLRRQVVEPFSAAQYFHDANCEPFKVPDSDHQTIAKPRSAGAIQHAMLVAFIRDQMIGPDNTSYAKPTKRQKISPSPTAADSLSTRYTARSARARWWLVPIILSIALLLVSTLVLYWRQPQTPDQTHFPDQSEIGTYEATITHTVLKRIEQPYIRDLGQFKARNSRVYRAATPEIGWRWDLTKPLELKQGPGKAGRCEGIDMNTSTEQSVSVFARLDQIWDAEYPFGADGFVTCSLSGTNYRTESASKVSMVTGTLSRMSDVLIDLPVNTTSVALKLRTRDGRERIFGGAGGDNLFDVRRSDTALVIAPKVGAH